MASDEEVDDTMNQITQLRDVATWFSIFRNNFLLTLPIMIPVFGLVWAAVIQFNTGTVIGMIAKYLGQHPVQRTLSAISSPIGILEYVAYSFIFAESIIILYHLFNREFKEVKERLTKYTWISLLIFTGSLLLGAVIEPLFF